MNLVFRQRRDVASAGPGIGASAVHRSDPQGSLVTAMPADRAI
jgi:hypothetical protein